MQHNAAEILVLHLHVTCVFLSHRTVLLTDVLDKQKSKGLSSSLPLPYHNTPGGFWSAWSKESGDFRVIRPVFYVVSQEADEQEFDEFNSRHVPC